MASRLGKNLLRAKSKTENVRLFALYPCYFFICCLAAPWPSFGYYWRNILIHLMLTTAFELSILVQRWLRGIGSLHQIECPLCFDHNGINHLVTHPKLQKIISPGLHPDFTKCRNAPSTQNSLYLDNVVAFRLV